MTLSDAEAARLRSDVDNLRHAVFGNGKEGLDEMIRRNTVAIATIQASAAKTDSKIDGIKESVDKLRAERKADHDRREGSVSTLRWMKWALGILATVLAIAGSIGYIQVSTQNQEVLQQLQRIPALPE